MSRSECLETVERELVAAGASYRIEYRRHAKVYVLVDGAEHLFICSRNAKRGRGIENSRAGIRRLLKQLGLIDC